jgi:molybdopterin biosynthesis enzyme
MYYPINGFTWELHYFLGLVIRKESGYQVTLNIAENAGTLASMVSANSLTILPERSAVKAGNKIRVLPLDWRRG